MHLVIYPFSTPIGSLVLSEVEFQFQCLPRNLFQFFCMHKRQPSSLQLKWASDVFYKHPVEKKVQSSKHGKIKNCYVLQKTCSLPPLWKIDDICNDQSNILKEWSLFSCIAIKNEQLRAVHIMLQLLEGLGHIMLQILFCVMQIIMVIIISPAAIKIYRAKVTSLLAYGTQIYNYHNLAVL